MVEAWLYLRKISVRRSKTNAVSAAGAQLVGLVGYSSREQSTNARDPAGEAILFREIPAAIQMRSGGTTRGMLLPGDVTAKPEWRILIPKASLPQYSIRDRDIIVDDEGYRYGSNT